MNDKINNIEKKKIVQLALRIIKNFNQFGDIDPQEKLTMYEFTDYSAKDVLWRLIAKSFDKKPNKIQLHVTDGLFNHIISTEGIKSIGIRCDYKTFMEENDETFLYFFKKYHNILKN